jgi:D-amino-acid dehydrogenase
MNIILTGAGVVGLTAAWRLAKQGHAIIVLDEAMAPAEGASGANGAQLSWRYTDPMGSPGIFGSLGSILTGHDEAISVHLQPRLSFFDWSARFLWECLADNEARNAEAAFEMAQASEQEFATFMAEEKIDFDYRVSGKLIIYRDQKSFDAAAKKAIKKQAWGGDVRALNAVQCIALDPTLSTVTDLAGGIYAPMDACGDCAKFTKGLAEALKAKYGVEFAFGEKVLGFQTGNGRVEKLITNKNERQADAYVITSGNGSREIAAKLGIHLPIEPIKGYSLTLPVRSHAPQLSITDAARRVVLSRLGDTFRISGYAEAAGYDRTVYPEKIEKLRAAAKELFPGAADYSLPGKAWAGFRPTTPSGRPFVGPTKLSNLYLNTGQGMYGFTQAHASAALLAKQIKAY